MDTNTSTSAGAGEILDAARELFAERGFGAVSISAIAERAGSSKANIFHHFGSKDGLYAEVMRRAVDRMTGHFQSVVATQGDSAERIETAIRGSLSLLFDDPAGSRLVFREVLEAGPARGKTLAQELFGEQFLALTRVFEDARARGRCSGRAQPSLLAFVLLSANVMALHSRHVLPHLPGGDPVTDPEQYVTMLTDLLVANPESTQGDSA